MDLRLRSVAAHRPGERSFTGSALPGLNGSAACFVVPGQVPGAGSRRASRSIVRTTRARCLPMDPDSIPTEPIIDPGPLDATRRRARPLPGLGITDGRPRTRGGDPPGGHRACARADVQLSGSGSDAWRRPPRAAPTFHDPEPDRPPDLRAGARPDRPGLGHPPRAIRGQGQARRPGPGLRRHQRADRGGRRHRPHLVPDPRGARRPRRRAVRARTSGSASGSTRRPTGFRSSTRCSRAARPRRRASRPATRSPRSTASRPAGTTSTMIAGWVRGEAGTTVKVEIRRGREGHRTRGQHRARGRCRGRRVVDDGPGHARPRSCGSTSSRTARPTTSRPRSARSRPPGRSG